MKKTFWFIFTLPIMLLPSEIFIIFWIILKPITFWQKLVTIIIGSLILPTIQTILFIFWLAFLVSVSEQIDSNNRKDQYIKEQKKLREKNRVEKFL